MFDWFWEFLYGIVKAILYCIDFIMGFASQLAGIDPVIVDGQETELTYFFLTSESILDAFRYVAIIGVVLLFIFTIFAVVRSIGKYGEEKTALQVCLSASKTILYFLLVPAIMILGSVFVSTFMTAIYTATSNGASSLGGALFTLFADEAFNGGGNKQQIMQNFMQVKEGFDYYNTDQVKEYFRLSKLNYFLSFLAGIYILVMIVKPLMTFVERIVSLVLLFIIAPISASTTVLDDGARFKLWRDQVINKFLIAYGALISINVFVLLIGVIYQVTFFPNSNFLNGLARLLFVMGGAKACQMGTVIIGNLINNGAGSQFAQDQAHTYSPMSRMLHGMAHLGGSALSLGKSAVLNNPLSKHVKTEASSAFHRKTNAKRSVKDESRRNIETSKALEKSQRHQSSARRTDFMKEHSRYRGLSSGNQTERSIQNLQDVLTRGFNTISPGFSGDDNSKNKQSQQTLTDSMGSLGNRGDNKGGDK